MEKKKIVTGSFIVIIVGITLGIVILSQNANFVHVDEPKIILKGDVVMSTKVSRPGCEKTDSCYTPS
ncbi:MAG: hypothetical protein AABY17_00890, partial [Thermoproteota archaeon]